MEAPDIELIKEIHSYFKKSGSRLCIAESCTGGLISHLLTCLPGASDFFDSSVVCYSLESKIKLLGIKRALIKTHGVISEEAARAMAIAIRKKRKTDFSMSTTGIIGPEPVEDKRVGFVYTAVDCERETLSRGMIFDGEREAIKYQAAISSLRFLTEVIQVWA
ncbi:MAG: hypothetical protein OHK0032_13040 [Thermodesulfovibrionales bacterium]